MKTSELIEMLQQSLEMNGDLEVIGICNGYFYEYIDTNVEEFKNHAPVLYLEIAE